MKICGIVAEYNPFHTGHAWLFSEVRRALGEDVLIVCSMSGNFVQRGEAAILPKYLRAEMAVRAGADLVVETPLAACLSSAEGFARGATEALNALGCTHLAFGCECADLPLLQRAAALLDQTDFSQSPRQSYAAARQAAVAAQDPAAGALLRAPNNTLAIEYCRAIRGSGMLPLALVRRGAAHDADAPEDGFCSASLLRDRIAVGELSACTRYMPPEAFAVLLRAASDGRLCTALPEQALLMLLRHALYDGALFSGSADGFDERIARAVYSSSGFSEIVERAKTRRYPAARVRRALWRALLGLPAQQSVLPQYLRVLALSPGGRKLLRRTHTLPVIIRPSSEKRLDAALQPALKRDAFADDFYALLFPQPSLRVGGSHFRQTPFCAEASPDP